MEDIDRRWRKSSHSGNGGECVEVGQTRDLIAVRDTRQDEAGRCSGSPRLRGAGSPIGSSAR